MYNPFVSSSFQNIETKQTSFASARFCKDVVDYFGVKDKAMDWSNGKKS